MFAGLRAWYEASKETQRRDITLLTLVATVTVLLACTLGGGTSKTAACNTTKSGCYAVAQYKTTGKDFTAPPHGVYTAIDVDQLGCDGNCVSEQGYIANYLMLTSPGLSTPWMEIGYRATGFSTGAAAGFVPGDTTYFTAYYDGINLSFVDMTVMPNADYGTEGQFSINRLSVYPNYNVRYAAPTGWNQFNWDTAKFTPGATEFGEILHGNQGESANIMWYSNGAYTTSDQGSLTNAPPTLAEFPSYLIGAGSGLKVDKPPYGKWITINDAPVWFETACCSSPL